MVVIFVWDVSIGESSSTQRIDEKETFNHVHRIKGTYTHRLLVNHFAMWVSPKNNHTVKRQLIIFIRTAD